MNDDVNLLESLIKSNINVTDASLDRVSNYSVVEYCIVILNQCVDM